MNESRVKSCLSRFDNGSYPRLTFLRAVSHCVGAHTAALQPADNYDGDDRQSTTATPNTTSTALHTAVEAADAAADSNCEVCFVAPHEGFTLVPCGHAQFCESCVNCVAVIDTCPVCHSNIAMVMRIFM